MKSLLLLALLSPASSFACDNSNPQLFVSNVAAPGLPLPQPPGRPGPRPTPAPTPDGSQSRPFRTLKDAIQAAQKRDVCQIRIRLDAGQYEGNVAVDRSTEILGKDRAQSRIAGGIFSTAGQLKLWDLGFVNAGIRAIRQTNGSIEINRVTVSGYHYVPNLVAGRPAAVELSNSKGSVTGLDVLGSDQPALLVTGTGSRVKVFGAGISGNHTSANADQSQQLVTYAGAVEIADGALVNLLVTTVKNNQYLGVLVRDQASVLVNASVIEATVPSTGFTTNIGPDGLLLARGAVAEVKSCTIRNNTRAGVLSLDSWITMRASAVRGSKYGFVNRDGATDGKDNYNSYKCATLDGTVLEQNETNYLPGGNLPVPNEPVPLPCPPGQTCPTPPPPPVPQLSCKSVPLL